ncbi:nuclease-related domain-containing protein [Paenibacillus sp. BSR1-1]|uniref:nuclease-related domain-containing protein n=1 Tax=Paenibacillus sp. BSR1-1 TaxID=3020845 RepID=UPI0025B22628|nr:nuclease-related domain-containing protein [Paenibacillus sp. BSR1-1]MDN3018438.1 nuclease-related domain-containing protein [Paenibacillus sp. BSR1-1]
MIIKKRTIPLVILILEALCRRLPLNYPKYQQILEELGRRQAGYQGEVALDYYLRLLPIDKYMILHDLNLPDGDYNCQIDTLFLTPEFALIVEVKNMAGKLIFDTENEQFTQINNDKEKGYPDPIAQAERHKEYIQKLMAENKFPQVPVDYLVVISNNYSSYVISGKNAFKVKPRVCKADAFTNKIQFFEKMYTNPLLTAKDLRKLGRLLVKMNTIPTNFILNKYGIKKEDIITGVFGSNCNQHAPLIRKKQKWYCTACDEYYYDAHINALKDYFLLIDSKITNREFREFVHLKSHDAAKRLLLSANLNYTGSKKVRVYYPKTFPW